MISINIRSDIKKLSASLTGQIQKQVAFASAQAINSVATLVQKGEQDNIRTTLAHPSPFTQNSVAIKRATKASPVATVYMKDIAARYLTPYEDGGLHVLPGTSNAILNPKDIKLNQYGQLPKAVLASLKARPDIFIGAVKTAKGIVNGVWQRVTDTKRVTLLNAKGKRLRGLNKSTSKEDPKGHLKLLIRFGDALPVKKQLNYGVKAKQIVDANLAPEFAKALAKAVASAK